MLEPKDTNDSESAPAESTQNSTPSDNLPPRRRRAASRPAGPPAAQEVAGESVVSVPVAPPEKTVSAPVVEEQTPDAAAKPARSRRRATRKVTAPTAAPEESQPQQPSTPAPSAAPQAEDTSATESEPRQAPAQRTRRRSSGKATRDVQSPPAAEQEDTSSATEAAPEAAPSKSRATRAGGRRSSSKSEVTASDEAPQTPKSESTKETKTKRPAAGSLFQAPVFTEPMFQTPQSAAVAQAASADADADEDEDEDEAVEPDVAEAEDASGGEDSDEREDSADDAGDRPSRRRRRGGRRRRRADLAEENGEAENGDSEDDEPADNGRPARSGKSGQQKSGKSGKAHKVGDDAEEAAADEDRASSEDESDSESGNGPSTSSSRRRRRRRRRSDNSADSGTDNGGSSSGKESGVDDPERTVVKVREPRKKKDEPSDEVQSIKGSTRLEAKKQRRREGREQGRRRVPIITEAEFLARREAVKREMIVRQHGERTQIAVLEDDVLVEHFVNKEQSTSYVGNVYLGKVQNVLPSMEAAFVDIGKGRNAVLYAGEVNFEALGLSGGPRRIENALKSSQSVLVQVTKDPIGHKGARLTSQVSLPGRYLVYVPEGSMTGISRKLPDTERARLKQILKKVVPEDAGVIVRTAAEGASEDELARDVQRLQAQWEDIQRKAQKGNAPTLLYGEPDMTVRVVRDIFNEDFSKVVISGDDAWSTVHGYVSHVAPDLVERLNRWTSDVDVFATYRIDEQLMKALDRKVWLPSGGSLVIDRTEAMIVVDVNTGKFTGQGGNLEETVTRNNLEAAEEIVRQLRLRDLGGIIVIDFIDMVLENNRDLVLRRLLECLGRDRTKHQVAEVTSLGLVQMTRKRVGQGLLESFSEPCVHCNGRGVIVHMEQPQGAGGGKRGKKKGKGGAQAESGSAPAEQEEPSAEDDVVSRERLADRQEPTALPEPEFVPDEELYSSAAEAESAAGRGRSRRRSGRRAAAAPSGPPKSESPAVVSEAAPEPKAESTPERAEERSPRAAAAPEKQEQEPSAPRVRRRASRKASAPAGSPKSVADAVVTVAAPERTETASAPAESASSSSTEAPAVDSEPTAVAIPARPRRRATRRVSAPAGTPEAQSAAAIVLPSSGAAADSETASGEEPEAKPAKAASARKTAAKKVAKQPAKAAVAKKAAAKKTTKQVAKKSEATKKSVATKKSEATKATKQTAKKATKQSAAKKAAAAEQEPASVED